MWRYMLVLALWAVAMGAGAESTATLSQLVLKTPIAKGVSMDEAVESMKLRANQLNMKSVAHQPLSQELKALNISDVRRTEIFQFCDAPTAKEMIDFDMNFAAFMPCRISLVEDENGKGWLIMMNPEFFLTMTTLPDGLRNKATKIRDNLLQIVTAGAQGEL
ncbi:MAG: DUF302 domain-containing protein [Thiotrichaceae bacterium]